MLPTAGGRQRALTMRDSGLELLRVLAMLMVTAHHLVLYNAVDLWSAPLDAKRLVFETAFLGMGKVGVVCFFGITAWFLCEREDGYRRALRRVWVMERELLFYSAGIYLVARFLLHAPVPDGTGWKAVAPLSSGLWWYPTSYATFLLLQPALNAGLRVAGGRGTGASPSSAWRCGASRRGSRAPPEWTPAPSSTSARSTS